MSLRLPSLRLLLLVLFAGLLFLLLFSWLALPHVIQYGAQKFIADKTHHRLRLDLPEINPLALRIRLGKLQLDEPDGTPLLGFNALQIELSAASVLQRAIIFKSIVLDDPRVVATLHRDGSLNWTALLNALKSKEPDKPDKPLPRLSIGRVSIRAGELALSDERENFSTRIAPLAVELQDLSTLADRSGHYHVSANTSLGAKLTLDGDASLKALGTKGTLAIETVDLGRFANYVPNTLPIDAPTGMLNLSTAYQASYAKGQVALQLDHVTVNLADLALAQRGGDGARLQIASLALKDGQFDLGTRVGSAQQFTIGQVSISLPQAAGKPVLLSLGGAALQGMHADLGQHQIGLDQFTLADGKVRVLRTAKGQLDLIDALTRLKDSLATRKAPSAADGLAPAAPASTAPGAVAPPSGAHESGAREASTATPVTSRRAEAAADSSAADSALWRFKLGKFDVTGFSAGFRDESVTPAADFLLEQINLHTAALSEDLKGPYPIQFGLKVRDGGQFTATGDMRPTQSAADLKVSLSDLALKPVQPYVGQFVRLTLSSGTVNAAGRVQVGSKNDGFVGSANVRDLRLLETDSGSPFLAWRSFGTPKLSASAKKLSIHELILDGLDTKLLIEKDKTINATRLLRAQPAEPGAAAAGKAPGAALATSAPPAPHETESARQRRDKTAAGSGISAASASGSEARSGSPQPGALPPFIASIEQLRIQDSALDFADQSLALPFGTRIHDLHGVINGLSNRPAARGQVQLDGAVDDYGSAHVGGELDLSDPTGFTDLKVNFRNVEMTRLTPYMATFAGRRIASGKLSLDLDYKIKHRQMEGDNQVIMDQLTLGERVESATATNLPLDLALAILQDADGRIELGLPVSGSLDDPQFSYGRIIWKALINVVEKIALSPFRALGSLFGGGSSEHFESVNFAFGDANLAPPEREKLVKVAAALQKRPGLSLTVPAVYVDQDRTALQDLQLRRDVAARAGQVNGPDEDPGPIAIQLPRIQAIVETLFSERLGKDALQAKRAQFGLAVPGGGAGPGGSAARGGSGGAGGSGGSGGQAAAGTPVTAEAGAAAQAASKALAQEQLHQALLDQLRSSEPVSDADVQALASKRAERIGEALRGAGMAANRVQTGAATKVEATGDQVACKPQPGAAASATSAAAAARNG